MTNLLFLRVFALLFVLGTAVPALAQCRLEIRISGFRKRTGQVYLGLYRQQEGFPGTVSRAFLHEQMAVPASGDAVFRLSEVPAGTYAVSVFDDEDGNGKMKTNWLGIPLEGVGVSNNVRSHFGPPHFRDAAVQLSRDTTLLIKLWFWGS